MFKAMAMTKVQEHTGVQELSECPRQMPAGKVFAEGHLRVRGSVFYDVGSFMLYGV